MSRGVLAQFDSVRCLVVGDLVADHYVFGQTERVSREAPVLIVRHERDETKLGGAANVAANARALGGRVTAAGLIGQDDAGRAMKRLFAAEGIQLVAPALRGVSTETKTRILAGGVNTSRQQMLRIDRGATGRLPQRHRLALARAVARAAASADVVVASDYGAGVLDGEVREILRQVARGGTPVCVDSRYALADFTGFTVCKPNEPELAALTGLPVGTDEELIHAAGRALEQLECAVLLVTRGRRGVAVFEQGKAPVLLPAVGQDAAVDVTGAGDTVAATFALSLGAGAPPQRAARLANLAGALVVQKQGTATVSRAELSRALPR